MIKKTRFLLFFAVTMTARLHTRRPIHIGGTIAPCYIRWWQRKFQGAKIPGCESSREQNFHGAKVPRSESSTPGTFAPGSEWSWERKVHNSIVIYAELPEINFMMMMITHD